MKRTDLAALLLLAALWGASYLFMRIGAGEFGALTFAGLRSGVAALLLLPLLAWRGGLGELRRHWRAIALVGLANSALPFVLFSYAALSINAGLSAIFNAATPLYTAAIAWLWLGERPGPARLAGLAVGFGGVMWLAWDKTGLKTGGASAAGAVGACVLATLLYGFAANFTRRHLGGVPALVSTAGGQLASAFALALPAAMKWPTVAPSARAWLALLALAVACTAVAYLLFFRLIARVGAPRAMTVTFLIPAFGVAWGALFLGEVFTGKMALGCAVILLGTALTTGLLDPGALFRLRALPSPASLPIHR